jgi:3'-phosphoadenosine 5'-phosphosulfate sulfotransferase (PAPS reductase)/FAD synthetase
MAAINMNPLPQHIQERIETIDLDGGRHIIPISGKDSLATAIVQTARAPGLAYEYIYNDTRMELPDTYAWMDKVEEVLGITIIRAGKSLAQIIAEQKILPSPRARYCTKYAKIYPMRDYIGKDKATIYIGIRADEDRPGAQETKNLTVRYPLKEMGVNLPLVYRLVRSSGSACTTWSLPTSALTHG